MRRNTYVVPYLLVLIAVIVSVDILFFRHRFLERLIVNIGIVLVFAVFYLRFLKKP
jgi:Mn2+/Fe2+ NRAMP family transporter